MKLFKIESFFWDRNNEKPNAAGKTLAISALCILCLVLQGCEFIDKMSSLLGTNIVSTDGSDETTVPVIVIETKEEGKDFSETEQNSDNTEIVEENVQEEIYDDDNKIYSKETASSDEVVLTFTGDVCFYDDYANMATLRAQDNGIFDCILPAVLEGLKSSDICMINNEFCYSDRGTPLPNKMYTLRSKPSNVSYLNDIGVDIVSLANNHAYDYGPDALLDTFATLKSARVPYVGAGVNIEEAMKPVYFKVNGKTISYTSATQIERTASPDTKEATEDSPGVLRTLDSTKMVASIEEAASNSDFTIVYVHWGSENTDLVEESQKKLARDYVSAGADLIVGDHSHCLQGIDYVDKVPVFYSLGNFWFNSKTVDTGYVKAVIDTSTDDCSIKELQFVPCIQSGCKTHLADDAERKRIIDYMQGISLYSVISEDGYVSYSDTNHNTQNGQNTSLSKKIKETSEVQEMVVPETKEDISTDLQNDAE